MIKQTIYALLAIMSFIGITFGAELFPDTAKHTYLFQPILFMLYLAPIHFCVMQCIKIFSYTPQQTQDKEVNIVNRVKADYEAFIAGVFANALVFGIIAYAMDLTAYVVFILVAISAGMYYRENFYGVRSKWIL